MRFYMMHWKEGGMYAREILHGACSGKDGAERIRGWSDSPIPRTQKQKQKQKQRRLRGLPWSGARKRNTIQVLHVRGAPPKVSSYVMEAWESE